MGNSTKVSGKITKCTAKVLLSGLMEEFTPATISKTKSMASVLSSGRMEKFMKDTGNKASRMVRGKFEDLTVLKDKEFGKTVIESDDDINFCNF